MMLHGKYTIFVWNTKTMRSPFQFSYGVSGDGLEILYMYMVPVMVHSARVVVDVVN